MKIKFIFALGLYIFNTYPIGEVEPCNKASDLEEVVRMVSMNDDDDAFMPVARSREEKAQLMKKFLEEPRDNFIIRNEEGAIIAYLTLAKRKSPSKEFAEELKTKYPEHTLYRQMLLSRPDLPEKSTGFIIRPSLIIAKGERRKSLGRKLAEYAIQEVTKDPTVEAIECDVGINNLQTIKLCQSFGAQEVFRNKELGWISFRLDIIRKRS